jgi:hypothetical protein
MSCLGENPNLEAFRSARARAEIAEAEQLRGNSEPYLAFWSRRADIMIFGGLGGHERGYPEVFNRLRWAATKVDARMVRIENLSTVVEGTMAVTGDLQHMVRIVDGSEHPRILRVTLCWRMEEDGWRIFYRHGDEYRPSGREAT